MNLVSREPSVVAGIPKAMLHSTICQSMRWERQYSAEANQRAGNRCRQWRGDGDKSRKADKALQEGSGDCAAALSK